MRLKFVGPLLLYRLLSAASNHQAEAAPVSPILQPNKAAAAPFCPMLLTLTSENKPCCNQLLNCRGSFCCTTQPPCCCFTVPCLLSSIAYDVADPWFQSHQPPCSRYLL